MTNQYSVFTNQGLVGQGIAGLTSSLRGALVKCFMTLNRMH